MRFAIFGDIHANLHALKVVLADAETHMCSHFVCMGDVVGYNAYPKQCIEAVRQLDCPVVKGNHDEQASMLGDQEGFNPLAEEAINWTREQLSTEEKEWLRSLRFQRQVRDFTERLISQRKELERNVEEGVKRTVAKLKLPRREEMQALESRLEKLTQRVEALVDKQ